jgi:hypothetical protein
MFDLCLDEDGAEHVIDDLLAGLGKLSELIELLCQLRRRATSAGGVPVLCRLC